MKLLLQNVLLALVWAAMSGGMHAVNVIAGLVLGFAVLRFLEPPRAPSSYFRRVPQALRFLAYFIGEIVQCNLRVAWDVITPTHRSHPGIVAVPLDARTEAEITLLANFVTLTPGTLALDISADRRTMYVHAMFAADPDAVRREIKEGLERRLLEVMR